MGMGLGWWWWLVPALQHDFTNGFPLDEVMYPSDDQSARSAAQCYFHGLEQNRLREATVCDTVALVMRTYEREGRSWQHVHARLAHILDLTKESPVKRWIVLARDSPRSSLDLIKRRPKIPQNLVIGNKVLVGRGEGQRYTLKPEHMEATVGICQGGARRPCFEICCRRRILLTAQDLGAVGSQVVAHVLEIRVRFSCFPAGRGLSEVGGW